MFDPRTKQQRGAHPLQKRHPQPLVQLPSQQPISQLQLPKTEHPTTVKQSLPPLAPITLSPTLFHINGVSSLPTLQPRDHFGTSSYPAPLATSSYPSIGPPVSTVPIILPSSSSSSPLIFPPASALIAPKTKPVSSSPSPPSKTKDSLSPSKLKGPTAGTLVKPPPKEEENHLPEADSAKKTRKRKKQHYGPCKMCGATESQEWRRGITGERNACNSCGQYIHRKKKEMREKQGKNEKEWKWDLFSASDFE